MRIVCDTNVLLSALIFPGGPPDQIVDLARTREVAHFTSPEIVTELRGVLSRKFRYSSEEANEFCARILAFSELVYPSERLKVIKRKDSDNRILACASTAKAGFLVTGDRRDLLPLRSYQGFEIVTAADLLRRMGEKST